MAENPFRMDSTGRIDRSRTLTFRFNGRVYSGYAGDSLASALLANGVSIVGRSFKYHRPRGIMSAGAEETNAFVQLVGDDDEPNVNAAMLSLFDGLEARSVNARPSVGFDLGAINNLLHRFIPAGFYYKTFMWPSNRWDWYGRAIRNIAGWGTAPKKPTGGRYEHRYHHCDVLVVGAGPAGLAAARSAGRAGARVLLVDNQFEPGGSLLGSSAEIDGAPAMRWVAATVTELDAMPEVTRLAEADATGYYGQNFLTVVEHRPDKSWLRERLWKVRAKQVVLATGAIERPITFANNDRPGVMLASAASNYCLRYGVRPGRQAVVFTNNNGSYRHAVELADSGVVVAAIVDLREQADADACAAARARGIEILHASQVRNVTGARRVAAVEVLATDGSKPGRKIRCDLLAVSGGWNPTIHLHSQSGGTPAYAAEIASFVPGNSVQQQISVGGCSGNFALSQCLAGGFDAGRRAAASCGFAGETVTTPACTAEPELGILPVWEIPLPRTSSRAFIDFNNDVTSKDIRLAVREGYRSVELVKRYTTAGMGLDQGKTGNVNIIGLLAEITGTAPGTIGTTTYRPAYSPMSFGAMAGADSGSLIIPWRRTPITDWFVENGGHLDETGALFRRPLFIRRPGETATDAINREALAVRNGVGIYDGTPLGKISVKGSDAVTFLNRVYTNSWDKLPVGRCKFGYMLHDDGRLLDDGVTFRLSEDHYLMSTGSGVAEVVLQHLEKRLHCDWPELDVYLTPVTDQWAVICVCGPKAREVMRAAKTSIDVSLEAFRFLDTRYCRVAGIDARVSRVTYTGELSFEIVVASRYGRELWEALLAAGKDHDITPVGSDTSMLLRTEKAFIAAGLEGDGYANIHDVGMAWVVDNNKGDFIGKRSTERDLNVGGPRPEIVGLLPADADFVPPKGAPIIDTNTSDESQRMIGMVTIGFHSPNLKRSIALAQLRDGRSRVGETISLYTKEKVVSATVCEPIFIDPDGERMRS
ncbi:MAG: sarcosine oxidase subunit alpha family protein [Gammaproteobacteria bacterium]|nr:sarcosine oxidase subunit alpha family protein [Gammaproteobacteria bacterium]